MEEKLKEYLDKYRQIPLKWRLLALFVFGLLPGFNNYYENAADLDLQITEKTGLIDVKKVEYNKMKTKAQNIPKLEEQLLFARSQLDEIKRKLPDDFYLDFYLRDLAKLADQSGIEITVFRPEKITVLGTDYKYEEQTINLETIGGYNQTATFFDKLIHFDQVVLFKNLKMASVTEKKSQNNTKEEKQKRNAIAELEKGNEQASKQDTSEQDEKTVRINTKVKTNVDMMIYRSARSGEDSSGSASATKESDKKTSEALGSSNGSNQDSDKGHTPNADKD